MFSLNHARLVILMATMYALYCVKNQAGWSGVLVSINLAFLSNDALNCMIQWSDDLSEKTHFEEQKIPKSFVDDDFVAESEFSVPIDEPEKVHERVDSYKSSSKPAATATVENKPKESFSIPVVKDDGEAIHEMKRILGCLDHYEALGFSRYKKIDAILLKKEYRKKVCCFHGELGEKVLFFVLVGIWICISELVI